MTIAIHRGDAAIGIRYGLSDLGGRDLGSGFTKEQLRVIELDAMGGAPFQLDLRTAAFGRDDERYAVTMQTVADEDEPDDRLEDAVPLARGVAVTRRITGRLGVDGRLVGDLDHHSIEVPRGGTLRIEATQIERARVRLTLLDRDGRRVGQPVFGQRGDDVQLAASVAPGTYVVRVEDINGEPQVKEPRHYRLAYSLD